MPLGDHLEELRKRLIWALIGLVPFLVVAVMVGRAVLTFLTIPVRRALLEAGLPPTLQATSPVEVFASYMKVVLLITILLGSWWVLVQIWKFVSPGLYHQERRFVYLLVPMSFTLTIVGTLFMYYVMLPVVLAFFINFGATLGVGDLPTDPGTADVPAGVQLFDAPVLQGDPPAPEHGQVWFNQNLMQLRIALDGDNDGIPAIYGSAFGIETNIRQDYRLTEYIKLVLTFAIGFAVGFQMPVVVLLLGWAGLIDRRSMAGYRKYILMGCCVIGAFLTPADPVSMFLLAGPLYLLFELGLLLLIVMPADAVARGFRRKPKSSDPPESGPRA